MKAMILAAVLLVPAISSATLKQPGQIVERNSGLRGTPHRGVPGVEIRCIGAGATDTDDSGNFVLAFDRKREGEAVRCRAIHKSGWELIDLEALERWKLSSKAPLVLVMAPSAQLAEEKQQWREAAETQARRITDLRISLLDSRDARFQFMRDSLEALYVQACQRSEELAQRFSRINLDDMSEAYRKAYEQFKVGNIDSAQAILRTIHVEERIAEWLQGRDRSDSLSIARAILDSSLAAHLPQVSREIALQVRILSHKQDIQRCEDGVKLLLDLDSSDTEVLLFAAEISMQIGKYDQASRLLNLTLTSPTITDANKKRITDLHKRLEEALAPSSRRSQSQ